MTRPEKRTLSKTPPMGWNSWDCFGTTVTEAEVLANAEFMAQHLLGHGWDTVVVDIQWYEPTARAGGYNANAPLVLDDHGRPQPVEARFPSSANGAGFAPLAAQVHDLGLRFGVHIMRGIPQIAVRDGLPVLGTDWTAADVADPTSLCDWNTDNVGLDHDHPGAQAYYDSLLAMFATWGVDFVKVDDMLGPYHDREIASFSQAVRRCGREMVLSLSPGRQLSLTHYDHLVEHADMWRVSDDLWDRWSDVYDQFDRMARWAHVSQPGAWPDADMLPLGRVGIRAERGVDRDSLLTWEEQRTLMTLWCISRSPLMFGGDLPSSDPRTLELLTNDAVLDALRHGAGARCVLREDDLAVWTSIDQRSAGTTFVAVSNLGDEPLSCTIAPGSLGLARDASGTELWTATPSGYDAQGLRVELAPHASAIHSLH